MRPRSTPWVLLFFCPNSPKTCYTAGTMEKLASKFNKLVLVCTNLRADGTKCCANGGSEDLRDKLKTRVKELGLKVRVSKSGCLDMCQTGPTVVIMPDNIWLGSVTVNDIEEIIELLK